MLDDSVSAYPSARLAPVQVAGAYQLAALGLNGLLRSAVMQRDAWFQVLIGSKRQELAKGLDDKDDGTTQDADLSTDEAGRLTVEERDKVMIDLRPR